MGSGVPESPESPSHQHWDTDATSDHHCPTPAVAPHLPNLPMVCTSSSVSQNYKYTCMCVKMCLWQNKNYDSTTL